METQVRDTRRSSPVWTRLDVLDWKSIEETDWRDPMVKERKQSEFLVEESFPWVLVERIGVIDEEIAQQAGSALGGASHRPPIIVARGWYY